MTSADLKNCHPLQINSESLIIQGTEFQTEIGLSQEPVGGGRRACAGEGGAQLNLWACREDLALGWDILGMSSEAGSRAAVSLCEGHLVLNGFEIPGCPFVIPIGFINVKEQKKNWARDFKQTFPSLWVTSSLFFPPGSVTK